MASRNERISGVTEKLDKLGKQRDYLESVIKAADSYYTKRTWIMVDMDTTDFKAPMSEITETEFTVNTKLFTKYLEEELESTDEQIKDCLTKLTEDLTKINGSFIQAPQQPNMSAPPHVIQAPPDAASKASNNPFLDYDSFFNEEKDNPSEG